VTRLHEDEDEPGELERPCPEVNRAQERISGQQRHLDMDPQSRPEVGDDAHGGEPADTSSLRESDFR
jgi:hypothetical protein